MRVDYEKAMLEKLISAKAAARAAEASACSDDERAEAYADGSGVARRLHDFLNANDIVFSPSDIESDGKGGDRASKIRRVTKARRTAIVQETRNQGLL